VEIKKIFFLFHKLLAFRLAHVHPFFPQFVSVMKKAFISLWPPMSAMEAAAYAGE
jgi:hypothetical protein